MKYVLLALGVLLTTVLGDRPARAESCSAGACSISCGGGCACINDISGGVCQCYCDAVYLSARESTLTIGGMDNSAAFADGKFPNNNSISFDAETTACLKKLNKIIQVDIKNQPNEAVAFLASRFCKNASR